MTLAGLRLPSPVGLAAGFDKNADAPLGLLRAGFGFVEVGTLTPRPQPGNPAPRVFRLAADRAVINRLGFNNAGLAAGLARLPPRPWPGVIGVNVGANKDSADRVADYAHGVAEAGRVADYVTINISSPNTPGLRDLQGRAALTELLAATHAARAPGTPLFLKVAPDLDEAGAADIAELALDHGVDALIVSNTTVSRPPLRSRHAAEAGGLSGQPLAPLALAALRRFAARTAGRLPLISAGGIATAHDVTERLAAGATAVQLYTALVYEGPGLPARLNRQLAAGQLSAPAPTPLLPARMPATRR